MRTILLTTLLAGLAAGPVSAQADAPPCPLHAQHAQHAAAGAELDHRGDQVMGFEYTRTTHHFRLHDDGGAIEVEVNDAKDGQSLGQIRTHLAEVAAAFAGGDFAMARTIHARDLPGVPELVRLKANISYRYQETGAGARVRITTADPQAVAAIHAFLRAQIEDHRTGDPPAVSADPEGPAPAM